MSKRSNRGTGSRRSRKPARPLVATAAAIGGAGIVLAAPGAAFMAPPEAQAQDWYSDHRQHFRSALAGLGGGIPLTPAGVVETTTGLSDPLFDLAGAIPILNIFVANGADADPHSRRNLNGGDAGLFIGSGGNGDNGPSTRPRTRSATAATAATPDCSSATAATAATASTAVSRRRGTARCQRPATAATAAPPSTSATAATAVAAAAASGA